MDDICSYNSFVCSSYSSFAVHKSSVDGVHFHAAAVPELPVAKDIAAPDDIDFVCFV